LYWWLEKPSFQLPDISKMALQALSPQSLI